MTTMLQNFNKWCELNAELSVVREDADKFIRDTAGEDLATHIEDCWRSIKAVGDGVESKSDEYYIRHALNKLAYGASVGMLTYGQLLETHNGLMKETSVCALVAEGCMAVTNKNFDELSKLWKQVNT